MKKRHGVFFGFAVLLTAAIFTMAGCDNGTTDTTDTHTHTYSTEWSSNATQHWHECTSGDGAKTDVANHTGNPCTVCGYDSSQLGNSHLITGKFASQTGEGEAVFYADTVSPASQNNIRTARSIARAVGDISTTEKELTGKIEDGDIVFNLKGVYNTETGEFYLSAGSSFLIYQIAGTVENDVIADTQAAVKVKEGDDWIVHEIPVTAPTEDVAIEEEASADQKEGIPSQWFGKWSSSMIGVIIFTPFQYLFANAPDEPSGLVDIVADIPGEKYTMIFQNLSDNGTPGYTKYVMEAQGDNLKATVYTGSSSEDYAVTSAYDITQGGGMSATFSRIADHTHEYRDTWSYNDINHFKECTVCRDVIDLAKHSGEPCNVCGYVPYDKRLEIAITGIEGQSNDAMLYIATSGSKLFTDHIAYGGNNSINGGFEFPLINNNSQPFSTAGSYCIRLFLDANNYVYTEGKTLAELGINGVNDFDKLPKFPLPADKPIAWNQFKNIDPSWLTF